MAAKPPAELKPLAWVGSAKRDLLADMEMIRERLKVAEQMAKELAR